MWFLWFIYFFDKFEFFKKFHFFLFGSYPAAIFWCSRINTVLRVWKVFSKNSAENVWSNSFTISSLVATFSSLSLTWSQMTKAAYLYHKTQSKYFFPLQTVSSSVHQPSCFWSVLTARVCFFISRYNYVITIMYSDYLKRNMLHKLMLQVWQHMFLIYFFKILFFLKKFVSATKKNFKSIWSFFYCWNKFFEKKMLCNKRKIPGDTQKFFMKLQQFEKCFAILWKSC